MLDWGLAVLCTALIVLAIASIGGSETGAAASQRTTTVSRGVVQSTVSGNGSLEAAQQVELNFGASGEVTAIEVKAGEKVKKGQVLARVDASSARASLASAEAQLSEAEESLESAEEAEEEEAEEEESEETSATYDTGVTTILAGYMGKEGTLQDGSSSAAEAKAKAEKEAKEAKEEEAAAAEEKGGKTAGGKGSTGESKSGEAAGGNKAGKGKTEAPTEEAGAAAPTEEAGSAAPTEAASEAAPTEAAPTEEAAAAPAASSGEESAAAGAAAGAGAVSVPTAEANLLEAQLSVKSARQEVRETTLRAPIAGTIASVSGAVGENVSGGTSSGSASGSASETSSAGALGATGGESTSSGSGSAFIVLAQLQQLKMEVSFSESDIGKVKVGQMATVAVDSLEGTELAGRVTKVDVLPSEGSSSVVEYPATILLTQSAEGLRTGMSASAEVVVEQVKDATAVSSEAIATGPTKTVTVKEGSKEVEKTVTTGLVGDESTQIVSGVKAGETVVLPEVTVAAASGEGAAGGGEAGGFPGGAAGGFPSGGFPGGGIPGGGTFPGGG